MNDNIHFRINVVAVLLFIVLRKVLYAERIETTIPTQLISWHHVNDTFY